MFYSLAGGAQLGIVLASRGYVARSGDIWGCHSLAGGQGAAGIQWVEVKNAAEHAARCRTAPLREPRIIPPKMSMVPKCSDLVAGY